MPDGKIYDPEIHTIEYLTGRKQEEKQKSISKKEQRSIIIKIPL